MRNVLDAVHNGKSRVIGQWAQSPPVQLSRGTIDYDGTLTEHASPNFCQTDGMWWGAGRVDRRLGCQEWDQLSAELPNVTGHQLTFDGWCILAHICQICTAIMLATFVREFTKRLGGLFGHLYERRGRSIWNGITHQTLEGGGMTPFPQCLIQLSKVVCVISDIYWTVVLWYSEVGYSMSWCVIKVCYHSKENRAHSRPSQQSKCKARPSLRSPSLSLLTRVTRVTCSSLMLPTTTHWYCHHHLAGLNTNRCFANIHMNALLGMNSCPEVIRVAPSPLFH